MSSLIQKKNLKKTSITIKKKDTKCGILFSGNNQKMDVAAMNFLKNYEAQFMNAKTPQDIRNIVVMLQHCKRFYLKYYYNAHVGWALPTAHVCEQVVGFWREHPSARVVDMGAGSGVFCMMFHDAGIPANKLLAVDKEEPIAYWRTTNFFWHITRDDGFEVPSEDIFFMAWGGFAGGLEDRLHSYVKRGGWCVMILGEIQDGCTFPSDYFVYDKDWDSMLIHVDGPASYCAEHLSINTRRRQPVFPFFFSAKKK